MRGSAPDHLSTLDLHVFLSDTTLMGYKIVFIDLLPYPDVNSSPNISEYKTELTITKQ